jgi:hypothetical protein
MFPNKTAASARMAVAYITGGALLVVWTVIWCVYLTRRPEPASNGPYYWCAGFFFSGLTLMIIGLAVGQIGRQARHADVPPPEAVEGLGDPAKAPGAVPGQPGAVAGQVPQIVVPVAVPPTHAAPQR